MNESAGQHTGHRQTHIWFLALHFHLREWNKSSLMVRKTSLCHLSFSPPLSQTTPVALKSLICHLSRSINKAQGHRADALLEKSSGTEREIAMAYKQKPSEVEKWDGGEVWLHRLGLSFSPGNQWRLWNLQKCIMIHFCNIPVRLCVLLWPWNPFTQKKTFRETDYFIRPSWKFRQGNLHLCGCVAFMDDNSRSMVTKYLLKSFDSVG